MKPLTVEITLPQALVNRIVKKVVKKLRPVLIANDNQTEEIMNVGDLASYLKTTPSWVYKRVMYNEIPFHKLGNRQLRFRKRDIDKWLEGVKTPAAVASGGYDKTK